MKRLTRKRLLAQALIAAAVGALIGRGVAQPPPSRSDFMRRKLESSKNLLEGLSREDFALIARDARALRTLSEQAAWREAMIPNAQDYLAYTREFQRLADELELKAKQKNLDGATLAYVQLTIGCVNCHKYARLVTK